MKNTAYVSINLQKANSLLQIIKFELSFILYENNADTFHREKPWRDSFENKG